MIVRNIVAIILTAMLAVLCHSTVAQSRFGRVFAEALQIVHRNALTDKSQRDLFEAGMSGMLEAIDRNSAFISFRQLRQLDEDLRQEYVGVGMRIQVDAETERLTVVHPLPRSPAQRAGLRVGDVITSIDGKETRGISSEEAVDWIRGPANTSVLLTIEREELDDPFDVVLVRQPIPLDSVQGDVRDANGRWRFTLEDEARIAYIRILQFGERTPHELRQALQQVSNSVDGIVIDLRFNSGGLLDAAVETADFFLTAGEVIVEIRDRYQRVQGRMVATDTRLVDSSVPIAVLINRFSASASEILAATLQDHNRAVVIGEQTYGKGTVQNIIRMEWGRSALRLTTSSYWRPNGQNIDRVVAELRGDSVWGVFPNDGWNVELTEQEIFEIGQARLMRDIEWHVNSGAEGEQTDGNARSPEAASADTGDDAEMETRPAWRDIDIPLRRAIEFIRQSQRAVVAA